MIDEGKPLPLNRAADELLGWRPSMCTWWRWGRQGIVTPRGRVRLSLLKIGGRLFVRPSALQEFIGELSREVGGDAPKVRTPTQRRRASERAAMELTKVGI